MSILSLVRRFTADFAPFSFRSGRGELTQPGLRQPFWFVIMQVGLLLLFSFLAERCVLEPFTGVIAVAVAVVYVGYLLLEELSIIVGYIDKSLTDPLGLVASHVRTFGNAWIDARQAVFLAGKTDKEAAHRCLEDRCRRLVADFLAGQPHLSIIGSLLRKLTVNLVLMVLCLAVVTLSVVKIELWQNVPRAGYHALCVENQGQFTKVLPRLIYSHTIDLQGGYDSSLAPTERISIIVSIVQAAISLMYVSIALGGALMTAAYILGRLTKKRIRGAIRRELEELAT